LAYDGGVGSVTGRRRGRGLVPSFEDPVPLEMFRAIGRVRFYATSILLLLDLAIGIDPSMGGIAPAWYWYTFAPVCAFLAIDASLGLWMWKRPPAVATMVRVTRGLVVGEILANVAAQWFFDTVHTHLLALTLVVVLGYRFFFDFRTGLWALATALVATWVVVALEMVHAIPIAPGLIGGIPPAQALPSMRAGEAAFLSIAYVLGFLIANLAVARLSHKEQALRLLRENLAAVDPARVGTHTGRTLCERYELGRLLGAGGMGEVYEGRHVRTGRRVAVKLLHRHLAQSGELVARFRREAEVTGALGSTHVVRILDVDDDDGQPFLVLEYLDGESLGARIARGGGLPPADVADIVAQVAEGLDAAHAAGVVHRDLKPDNVFLARTAHGAIAKILDFGISKIQGDATAITREIALLGTPDFMAPEQTHGGGAVGPAADRFALGAIAYTALTGTRPFAAQSIPGVLRAIAEDEPVPPSERVPGLPAAVDDVLAIAMSKRPDQRFGSAAELAEALAAAIGGEPSAELAARAAALVRGRRVSAAEAASRARAASEADTMAASTTQG